MNISMRDSKRIRNGGKIVTTFASKPFEVKNEFELLLSTGEIH